MFLLSRSESRLLANHHGWSFKTIHCFDCGKLGIFGVWMHAVWAVQCPCHLAEVDGELPRELNLMYCLIYLENVIVFSKTEEEHLKHLCIVSDCFWEHNLRLKPNKCKIFQDEINYVSKEGVRSSKENLQVVAEFTPPWTYTKIQAFLGLVEHYR